MRSTLQIYRKGYIHPLSGSSCTSINPGELESILLSNLSDRRRSTESSSSVLPSTNLCVRPSAPSLLHLTFMYSRQATTSTPLTTNTTNPHVSPYMVLLSYLCPIICTSYRSTLLTNDMQILPHGPTESSNLDCPFSEQESKEAFM